MTDTFVDMVQGFRESTPEPPSLGNSRAQRKKSIKNVVVRYFVAHMDDPGDQEFIEHIFTKSLQGENSLDKPGDVCVFKEESNFDKTGAYTVAIKYAEYLDPLTPPLSRLEDTPSEKNAPSAVEDFDV